MGRRGYFARSRSDPRPHECQEASAPLADPGPAGEPGNHRTGRTINAIERGFHQVPRCTRPSGPFRNRTSRERILLAVCIDE
jgi:hypothetical protein